MGAVAPSLRSIDLLRQLAFASVAVVLWSALLWFPEPATGRFLDQAWSLSLGHFMKTRQQAGVDYVWTYGPLGYLAVSPYVPGLFGLRYAWTIAFAAVSALVLVRSMRFLPSRWTWPVWVWLALALLPRSEAHLLLLPLLVALLHLREGAWSPGRLAATAALFAVLALVKFTLLMECAALVVVLAVAAPREDGRRAGLVLIGSFAVAFIGVWSLSGQALRHIPRYLFLSMELALGYSGAMSVRGDPALIARAFQIIAILGAAWATALVLPGRARGRFAVPVSIALGLFMSWKEGLVRQDQGHTIVFFSFAPFAALLLAGVGGPRPLPARWFSSGLLACGATLSLLGVHQHQTTVPSRWFALSEAKLRIAENLAIAADPAAADARGEAAWSAQQREWALPRIKERVGESSIDVATIDQSIVIWNGLNWKPRPVFQSYSVWTPLLARLNGLSLRRRDAPRYVLVRWAPLDERFPAQDDGVFLLQLLRRYRPVLTEKDYLLFQQRPPEATARPMPGETVLVRRLAFDERLPLALDGRALYTLAIRVETTAEGRLRRLLYRTPPILFIVEPVGHPATTYTLTPDAAREEFLLSPLVESNRDLERLHAGEGLAVSAIRFALDDEGKRCFGGDVEVTIRRQPPPFGTLK